MLINSGSNNPTNNPTNNQYNLDGSIRKVASGVSNEFHNFLCDIEDLFKATTSLTGDDLAKAKAKISARIDSAKESIEDVGASVSQHARKTAAMTNTYVHEQPWTVIGAGAAVSFLLGFLLARRS
jgi:ElaB/YqjD/DUF883 family membrane-anchored ribosome-binding protein